MGKIAWMVKPKNRTEKQIIKVITNTISAIQKTITVFLQGIYMVFLWDQADVQQIARLIAKLFILIYQIVNLILGTKQQTQCLPVMAGAVEFFLQNV